MNGILHIKSEISHVYHACLYTCSHKSVFKTSYHTYSTDLTVAFFLHSLTMWLRPPQTDVPLHCSLLGDWDYQREPDWPPHTAVSWVTGIISHHSLWAWMLALWHSCGRQGTTCRTTSLDRTQAVSLGSKCLCQLALPLGTFPGLDPLQSWQLPPPSAASITLYLYISIYLDIFLLLDIYKQHCIKNL